MLDFLGKANTSIHGLGEDDTAIPRYAQTGRDLGLTIQNTVPLTSALIVHRVVIAAGPDQACGRPVAHLRERPLLHLSLLHTI